jgi:uncharacterized protein YbaR (Trm112 family)
MEELKCPECRNPLEEVKYNSSSVLNEEQFMSIRAGDYYCKNCNGTRGKTGYKYFWKRELENLVK